MLAAEPASFLAHSSAVHRSETGARHGVGPARVPRPARGTISSPDEAGGTRVRFRRRGVVAPLQRSRRAAARAADRTVDRRRRGTRLLQPGCVARRPRRISVSGHVVRLGGFRTQDPMSIDLVGGKAGRHITTLLVVPVETSPDAAEAALAAGCDPDGVGTLRSMLGSPSRRRRPALRFVTARPGPRVRSRCTGSPFGTAPLKRGASPRSAPARRGRSPHTHSTARTAGCCSRCSASPPSTASPAMRCLTVTTTTRKRVRPPASGSAPTALVVSRPQFGGKDRRCPVPPRLHRIRPSRSASVRGPTHRVGSAARAGRRKLISIQALVWRVGAIGAAAESVVRSSMRRVGGGRRWWCRGPGRARRASPSRRRWHRHAGHHRWRG